MYKVIALKSSDRLPSELVLPKKLITLPETNIAPENKPPQYYSNHPFLGAM